MIVKPHLRRTAAWSVAGPPLAALGRGASLERALAVELLADALVKALGAKTPIDPGLVLQATGQATRSTVDGGTNSTWMGPNQPIVPQHDDARGRQWDYPVGVNLRYTPRGDESISFAQLRALADNYDLLRLLIETRKDQLVKFKWSIAPVDEGKEPDKRCVEVQKFLRFPDRRHNWQTWLRALVEDMLVIDAATVYPRLTRGSDVYALDLMDGATLKLLIDASGRIPEAPDVAYQQVLKGIPAVNYSTDEVIYAPRNVRTNRLYGFSPVEQIVMTVNIALRRQLFTLQYYTEGNIPEALMSVPKEWNVDQIAKFQQYWDTMIEGNTAARRHAKFIPDGVKYQATKDEILKDQFDEWLARICCFAFSVPPTPFVREMNRATGESAKEAALEEGLVPLMAWIKDLLDLCIWKYWGYDDLQFQWQDAEPMDPVQVAQVHEIYLRNGALSVDEVRQDLGRDSLGMPNAIYTATGAVLLTDMLNPPEPDPAAPAPGAPADGTNAPADDKKAAAPEKKDAKAPEGAEA